MAAPVPPARETSSLHGLSEDAILARIDAHFPRAHASLLTGRGDDCAVLAAQGPLCLSTDMFLEDVHFRRRYFSAEEVGYKALAVNVSDLAGMGAEPAGFSLCLGLPRTVDAAWLEDCLRGMGALARVCDLPLVGGDLSAAQTVQVSITIWGRQSGGAPFLHRGAVAVGDTLFVVGALGLARVGLLALEAEGRTACTVYPAATMAHLRPEPQLAAGRALAALAGQGARLSLMDISDGLLRDIPRLLGAPAAHSGACGAEPTAALGGEYTARGAAGGSLGATLHNLAALTPDDVRRYAVAHGLDPVQEVLRGGEDYALLGACAPQTWPDVCACLPQARAIGEVTAYAGLRVGGQTVRLAGFDHFSAE